MKRVLGLAVSVTLTLSVGTQAKIGTLDAVPGATLLLPYFEVNPHDPNGVDTVFTINNAGTAAQLTRVTLWTDYGVPTYGFDVYLTGYDSQEIDLREVFNGRFPQTADVLRDPADTISNKGSVSQDIAYPDCQGVLPPDPLTPNTIAYLQKAHSGQSTSNPSFINRCFSQNLGDTNARGYVTVDTVNKCSADPYFSPATPGYFGAAGGVTTDVNALWGDFHITSSRGAAAGERLVSIEASPTDPRTTIPGTYTFYARQVYGLATDHREALGTRWGVTYVNDQTDVIVWRDPQVNEPPPNCSGTPQWYPLLSNQMQSPCCGASGFSLVFDNQEGVAEGAPPQGPIPLPVLPPSPFPAVTNRTRVGSEDYPVPFKAGWMLLDFNIPVGVLLPQMPYVQSYVMSLEDLEGQGIASTMVSGTMIEPFPPVPPPPTPTPTR